MIVAISFLAVLGAALVVLGVNSIKDPISWYNRAKVEEENKTIFGKLMGTAQVIGGIGILILCLFTFIAVLTTKQIFMTIGMYLTIATLAVAICIYIFTLIKYYKKIS